MARKPRTVQNQTTPDPDGWKRDIAELREPLKREEQEYWVQGEIADRIETSYGEGSLRRAAQEAGTSHDTLRKRRQVYRAYREKGNRFPNLRWTHHLIMAGRPDRREWLQRADRKSWSVPELRGQLRQAGIVVDEPTSVPAAADIHVRDGDLYALGDHRLLCGDATSSRDVRFLMDGERAALFATDPPYGVDYTGDNRPVGGLDWRALFKDIPSEYVLEFLLAAFWNALPVLREDAAWFCWHADSRVAAVERAWRILGVLRHQRIIWTKPSALPSWSLYNWQYEPCLVGWREGHKPDYYGEGESTVWNLDWEGKKRPSGEHPTEKPIEAFSIPMLHHTEEGELCYEPFSGRGTQIVAAEKLKRRCYAIEKEPLFVQVAIDWWERETGKKAKKVGEQQQLPEAKDWDDEREQDYLERWGELPESVALAVPIADAVMEELHRGCKHPSWAFCEHCAPWFG
jgi:DNA modification methylase